MLPEIVEMIGLDLTSACCILTGIAIGFVIDLVIYKLQDAQRKVVPAKGDENGASKDIEMIGNNMIEEECCDNIECDEVKITSSDAHLIILGDGLCNFVDGAVIANSYLAAGLSAGITATLAVAAHELPTEIGEFSILMKSGWSVRDAFKSNFYVALSSVVGVIFAMWIGSLTDKASAYLLCITCGTFIYISFVELLPALLNSQHRQHITRHIFWLVFGLVVIALITEYAPHHHHGPGHEGHDDHGH